ncbi:MAG: hypothetical protein ACPIGE_05540, partial [Parvibaculales bacterium]
VTPEEAQSDMAAAEAAATQAQEEAPLPFETQAVKTIWRPAPRSHNKQKKNNGKKSANGMTGKKNMRHAPRKAPRHRAEKPANPLSPFAVLKQLNQNGEKADEA